MATMTINFQDIWDNWETHLEIDAMYFHAARQAHERAKCNIETINSAENRFASLDKEFCEIESKRDGDFCSAADELDRIGIQLSDAHDEIGLAYAPLLKEVAVVHILSTASLEAHINSLAKDLLEGKELEYFQGLKLAAKWLFLPRMVGLDGFKPGHPPFQSFSNLLKFRNKLIHYKGVKESWTYGAVPKFVVDLGLTIQNSQESIETVDNMVTNLTRQRGVETPYWLGKDLNETIYFKVVDKNENLG